MPAVGQGGEGVTHMWHKASDGASGQLAIESGRPPDAELVESHARGVTVQFGGECTIHGLEVVTRHRDHIGRARHRPWADLRRIAQVGVDGARADQRPAPDVDGAARCPEAPTAE